MSLSESKITEHLQLVIESINHLDVNSLIHKALKKASIYEKLIDKERVFLVGVGKVSIPMSDALVKLLPQQITSTIIISLENHQTNRTSDFYIKSSHPNPSQHSKNSATKLIEFLYSQKLNENDAVIFAISGGTSAMLMSPTNLFNLTELKQINKILLESGEDVSTINKIRKAISKLHGGGLLKYTGQADVYSLILCDNAQSDIKSVGSGLTFDYDVDDTDINHILERLELSNILKKKIRVSHTRKKTEKISDKFTNIPVADTNSVAESMAKVARERGYEVFIVSATLQGEVREVAKFLGNLYKNMVISNKTGAKLCIISSGELTVKVNGKGQGGRCQELAWCMAKELNQLKKEVSFISFATDGNDFIPGIAGAWATNNTYKKIINKGMNWRQILNDNNSNYGLQTISQLIKDIKTSINLCDLYVLFSD
ncbi:DUF4147 domain-containing protein [Lysinibacillus sp. NPDC097195]|uniref:DUF4147 domain-containing protein n=1 Tax=Lysinibacillus sp. NPDC097195 TaxID=3364141 RepID=UPI0038031D12